MKIAIDTEIRSLITMKLNTDIQKNIGNMELQSFITLTPAQIHHSLLTKSILRVVHF